MRPPLIDDIEYFITRKEKQIEYLNQQGKSTTALQYEVQFLQGLQTKFEELLCENLRQMREFARIEKDYKYNKKGYKIVSGLVAARKWACMTKQPYAWVLQRIEENPTHYIECWRDLLNWYRLGDKELRQFEEWYSPYESDNADVYKRMCESYGYNYKQRLQLWQQFYEKRQKKGRK